MMKKTIMQIRSGDWITTQSFGFLMLPLSALIIVIGYHAAHGGSFRIDLFLGDLYANLSAELIGIAITVLLIDNLNRRSEERISRRHQLARQLGSHINAVATEAANELRTDGWLTNGRLQSSDLSRANLSNADLSKANLGGVDLQSAHLEKANLSQTKLIGANLSQTNLEGARLVSADLKHTHLERANLQDADLRGAALTHAIFDEGTTLPDGTNWSADIDLARFTDPQHPNFWHPANVE